MKYRTAYGTDRAVIVPLRSRAGYIVLIAILISSCAPVLNANIDYTLSGEIKWPGPPEKPRIQYLWSLYSFVPDEDLTGFLVGSAEDLSDPSSAPYLVRPYGLFVDEKERLSIVDQGASRATVVDMKTKSVMHFGYDGYGQLYSPIAIAVDNQGNMYVTDSEMGSVNRYDQTGKFLGYIGKKGDFKRPTGIAIEKSSGRLYVVDTAEHRCHVFDTAGKELFRFGGRGIGDGEFNYPTYIATGYDGTIYVSDSLNFRIQIFDTDGRFLAKFGRQGDTYADLEQPKGVAVDRYGHIYVVDSAQDMVKIFDRDGRLLLFFGENGRDPGKLLMPSGIFIDGRDRIYISDTYNMRIQAFEFIGERE